MLNRKKIIALTVIVAIVIIVVAVVALAILPFNREGIAFSSGTFTSTSSGAGFTFGVQAGSRNGIYNVTDNTWRATPYRANGNSRVDYTFTAANLEAMTVESTNAEGRISLTFTQGDTERAFDVTNEFHENIDMSGFEPGRIRVRLVFENASDVNTLIRW
ncbi:MAG: hypothetical protein FWF81_05550 [Defluviitaleaceae bacterium]|nr:hypothetical protein [Defluviitaleaceae bacterium]